MKTKVNYKRMKLHKNKCNLFLFRVCTCCRQMGKKKTLQVMKVG